MEYCIIKHLLENPFSQKSFIDKDQIFKQGRPKPALSDLKMFHKDKGKTFTRHFQATNYEKYPWLCGSAINEKLYCWPCILFSVETTVWNKHGFDNLNCLTTAVQKHSRSQNHIRSFLQLQKFGNTHNDLQLNEEERISIMEHNEMVNKNRDVLKRLIDTVCHLAKLDSLNRGIYLETLNLLSIYDPVLKTHMESATVFNGTTNQIQNDLIESVSGVVSNKIKNEIETVHFVSIIFDETCDIVNLSQLSIVLRYVTLDGKIYDRFLSFSEVSSDKTAESVFKHIVSIVDNYNIKDKLIGLSFDGAAVNRGQMNELCTKILQQYPKAVFVHCFSHKLNLILQQVLMNLKECRLFFSTLSGLAAFFTNSPKRNEELKKFMAKKLPRVSPNRWIFTSRIINTVSEFLPELIEFFENLIQNSDSWNKDTLLKAQGFRSFLINIDTCFLLIVFSKLFSYTDILYDILQTKYFDVAFCNKTVQETQELINEERNNFDKYWEQLNIKQEACDIGEIPINKKRKLGEENNYQQNFRLLYYQIIDTMIMEISDRFGLLKKFEFLEILDPSKFYQHKNNFPENAFKVLKETYPGTFDFLRLKNELCVLYGWSDFQQKYPHDLVPYMQSFGLIKGMPEVYKLACLYLTLPSSTAPVERSFSALKRIKSYIRATQGQERFNDLALLSIEKTVLCELQKEDNFYCMVIDEFCKKERRLEFTFK